MEHGLGMSQGSFLADAPAGKGLLHSGGNDSANLDLLIARDEEHLSGRRVKPRGTSPNNEEGDAQGNSGRLEDIDPGRLIQREIELMEAEEAERILKYKECR